MLNELLSSKLFNILPDACMVFDSNWQIVKMNPRAEQIFLLPKDYIQSKPFWEIAPQYIKSEFFDALHKVKEDRNELHIEFCGLTTGKWYSGTARWVGNYVILFFRDITAQKHGTI